MGTAYPSELTEAAPVVTASGNTGSVSWTSSKGRLEIVGLEATLVLPNRESFYGDEAVVVTATDSIGSASVSIGAYATFPYQPDPGYEATVDAEIEISKSEDRSESSRILSDLFGAWPLTFVDRERTEYRAALAFYDRHRKANKWFYLMDGGLEEIVFGRFDSEFKRPPNKVDGIGYSFAFYAPDYDRESARDAYTGLLLDAGELDYSPETVSGMSRFLDALNLSAADGAKLPVWEDLSEEGNDAVQPTSALQLTYHAAEEFDGLPYVRSEVAAEYMTVSCKAGVKTIIAVVRRTYPYPLGAVVKFDDNNQIIALNVPFQRWADYRELGLGASNNRGYTSEFSIIARVVQSSTSASFYVDGQLAETYTTHTDQTLPTSFTIGPGCGDLRQIVEFPRALTSDEIARHTRWLRLYNQMDWIFDFQNTDAGGLITEAVIVRKEGFTGLRPLVIMSHPAGYTERIFLDLAPFRALLSALLDQGYVVAFSRLGDDPASGYNNWGNQFALDANVQLYNYCSLNHQIDPNRVAMLGTSMGGLATLLAFPNGGIPVKGAALYDPVTDLAWAYGAQFTVGINAAYGITGTSPNTYAEKTAGHDPRLRAASDWAYARFRFYRNSGDLIVNPTENSSDFAAQVAGVSLEADIVNLTGNHLEGIEGTTEDLIAFFERCFEGDYVPPTGVLNFNLSAHSGHLTTIGL